MLAYDFYGLGSAPLFLAPPRALTAAAAPVMNVLTAAQQDKMTALRAPLRPLSDRQVLCLYVGYQKVGRELGGTGAPQAAYVTALTPLFATARLQVPADLEYFFDGAILQELWDRDLLTRGSKTAFAPKGQMWLWTAPPKVFYVAGGAAVGVGALVWFLKFKR